MAQPWEVDWSKQGAGKADDDSTPPWERKWGAAPAKKPEAAKTRNPAAFLNDTVIEAGNAVAGAVKSVGDFLAPGNRVSEFIDTNIIKAGEANQSDAVKAEKAKYRAEMEGAEGIGDEIGATLGYVVRNPIQSLAQAAGSFAVPGAAVKAGGMLGSVAGLGVQGATRTGLAGGAVAGAALSGGDAAGTAYELVKRAGGSDKEATEAARRASVLPAAIGAAGGVIGAERLLAGAGGFKGGALSRALTTAGVEGAQEAVEEGVTQYEGQRAAVPFDPSIDPLKGVAGAATMGAVLGGATGAGVSLLHGKPAEQKKDAGDILAAPTVDAAISNAMLAIAGPVAKPAWEVVDGLALPGPAQPEAPTMLRSLPAPDGQPVYMADERGNVAPQPAEARTEALNRQFEAGQQAEAAARATDALGITPGLRRAQQQRELRDAEGNLIPVGEATELPNIPTGDATELEPIPAGEAAELVPTPDATELEPIPAGEATELEVQTIEPGDLMAKDGEPFVSKTGAQARAFSAGGRVVSIPDHFGSGKPGYVVRPITEVRPNNTRGTNAADAIRVGGAPTADAGRGNGVAGVPDSRPSDVLASPAATEGQGVAGAGTAGGGSAEPAALSEARRGLRGAMEAIDRWNDDWRSLMRDGVAYFQGDGKDRKLAPSAPDDIKERYARLKKQKGTLQTAYDEASAQVKALTPAAAPRPAPAPVETPAAPAPEAVKPRQLNGSDADKAAPLFQTQAQRNAPNFTEGQRVTLNGTPYTVTAANNSAVKLQGEDGAIKMVARNSRTFQAITPEPNEAARPQPEAQRAEAAAPAAAPAPAAPAATGPSLTPGQRVTLPNKDGVREVWTVDGQTGNILRLDNGKGRMRAVQVGSPTWDAIQPEGGAATDQATNQNGVSETAGGKPLAGTLQPTPQADAKPAPEPARTQALAPAAAAATEPAAAPAGPAGLEADGLTTEPSGGPELEAAGFKNTPSMPNGWGRTVMDGPNVKHLFGVREFGTPKKYRVTRSTSFPGTSMTGAPTLELGTFSTPGQALAAVQSDLEKRMPGRAPAVATPNAEASAQAATRGAEAAPAAPAPSDVSTSAPNLNTSPERVQKAPESEQVAPKPKVYKNLMAAKLASKQGGNTTRVKKISGGYILREATEKELAAAEKAGRRLAAPKMVDQENDPLLTAIAKLGGLAMTEKADTIGEGNKLTKGGHLFRQGGQGIDTMAESLKELHYIPSHEHERDGGVRWLRDAIKAEYMGSREHFSEAGDKWMEDLQAEAESRYNQDALSDFDLDELGASRYTQISPEAQALTEQLLAEAEALGLDTETLRDDAVRASEGKTDDEYHAELQAIAREAIGKAQRDAEERNAAATGRSTQDDGKAAGDQGQEGSGQGLTLTAQTAEDLKAKTEREAAGEAAAKAKRDAEQARLRKEAEARDLKARADATVDDFQLGQDADQQMSGMDDLFAQPAPAPAEQAAAILNAAAEPPKGKERLDVLKDVKAGAITPEEVAAAYPAKEPAAPTNTEDAGAELTYNRRNRIKSGIKWDDIASKNDALKVKEAVKQNVYPRPDYQALVDGGMQPLVAHLVKQAYDAIAAKPNTRGAPTDADLQTYIAGVNRVMSGVLAWANDPASVSKWAAREARSAGAMLGKSVNLSELAPGGGKTMMEAVYPDGWKGNQAEVIVLGGNKLLGALQPSYDEAKRAGKAVDAGWPASQEAWEKRGIKVIHAEKIDVTYYEGKRSRTEQPYVSISYRVGQTRLMDQLIDGAESKDDPKVQAAVAAELEANQGMFIVMDKARRIVGKQETEEAAKDVARELTKREGKDGGPDDSGIDVAMARREGPPRRLDGENVSSDQLKEAFGFKGVNFGNWMKGDTPALRAERQAHLNHAYDSFADLADLFGVPPKAMSLNGMLGLAIGAQGNGKYAAHFVPGVNEINLTRASGAGSLAHEWGHALDHYFAEQAGFAKRDEPFLTEHTTSVVRKVVVENGRERMVVDTDAQRIRPEIVERFKAIVQAMNKKPETVEQFNARQERSKEIAKSNVSSWLKSIRRDYVAKGVDEAAIDAIAARILALDVGDGKIMVSPTLAVHPVVDELRSLYRKKAGRVPPIDQIKGLQSNLDYYAYAMSEKPGAVDHVPQQVGTDYAAAAAALDKDKGGKRYWSTNLEKFARAFDAFVSDELEAKAAKNTYLSHAGRTGETVPMGDERVTINAAIKALVGEIQTREDDAGNVAMFSRAPGARVELEATDAVGREFWRKIDNGEAFTDQEVLDALSINRRGSRRFARAMESVADKAGSGQAAIGWQGDLASFGAYTSRASWDGENFNVFFVPDSLAAGADLSDEAQARDRALVSASFKVLPDGRYELSLTDPQPGSTAVDALERAGVAERAGTEAKPYTRVDLSAGDVTSRSIMQEAVRRLALNIGQAPNVMYAARDTGARAGRPGTERNYPADTLRDKFSRAPAGRTATMTVPQVQGIVANIKAAWRNAPNVVVVESLSGPDVPERVREAEKAAAMNGAGVGRGVILGDTVYLAAGAMATDAMVAETLFHEALGHYGLRGMFGKDLDTILGQLAKTLPEKVTAKAIEYGLNPLEQADRLTAAEEVLAEIAQTRPTSTWVQRAIAAIRTWLRTNIPGFADMALNEAEVIRNFIMPARAFVERGRLAAMRDMPAFSRNSPSFASASDQTQTPAFRAWFGDSKVVDADGKPLVVYHGTTKGNFTTFDRLKSTEWRSPSMDTVGSWFSDNPSDNGGAGMYAAGGESTIYPVYLSIKNPKVYRTFNDFLRHMHRAAGRPMPESAPGRGSTEELRAELKAGGYDGIEFEQTANEGLMQDVRDMQDAVKRAKDDEFSVPRRDRLPYTQKRERLEQTLKSMRKELDEFGSSTELDKQRVFIAFEPEQIKSAIGNSGAFDPGTADIRFSRAPSASAAGGMAQALRGLGDAKLPAGYIVNDFITSNGKLNWWHKTVGSMHNLAQRNPLFKPVYDAAQNFLNDVSSYATEAADMAPTLLPKLEGLRDIGKSPLSPEDTKAISAPIFEGTLSWTRDENGQPAPEPDPQKAGIVWTDAELRDRFKLNAKQRGLYREMRAAVDKSLTDLAVSDMIRYGGKDVAEVAQQARDAGSVSKARDILTGHLADMAETQPDRAGALLQTGATIGDKAQHAQEMMRKGYAPLTRFGHYTLDVTENGRRVYFGLFESQSEANRFARKLKADYPKATYSQGTMSDEAYKMFAGVSPETLELFGQMLGLESQGNEAGSQAFQEFLKLTKSNRSAMKRLIERKGIAGYSEDAGRVLAGFVYSNARQASKNLHTGTMAASVQAVAEQKGKGELLDTAVKLHQYITNPQEEVPALKGLLFAQFLGGSIAAGMVNLTQPVMVTFPYLSQYGGVAKAAGQMKNAMADAVKWASGKGTGDARLDAALKHAEEEGIVSPQEVHSLMAQARGSGALKSGDGTALGDTMAKGSNFLSKLTLLWGRPFALAEQYNRQVTFIAAFRTAVEQKIGNPALFAEKAVNETQFTYTKANRPQWARGAIGSTLFTFKTYSISYVELLARMAGSGPDGRKAALLGLGVLFLMSGLQGLPGADDLDDVIDGLMQRLGYNFSSKMAKREFFAKLFGEGGAAFLMKGASGLPGAPIDVAGRLGLGNLIPGTGLFTKKTDHTQDVAELFGPAGSFAKQGFTAADKLTQGEVGGAFSALLPVAAQNAVKAADMASTGMYRDQAGRKVIDTDSYDAMVKAIGFQPNDVAKVQQASREVQGLIGLNKMREAEIADKWARGIFEKDAGMVQDARQDLADWNRQNPESPIKVNTAQLMKRLKAMREDKISRIEHTAPKEIRATVRREIEGAL